MLSAWITGAVGSIGKLLYPSDPDIAYKTGAGNVLLTEKGQITQLRAAARLADEEGVPIDYGSQGVTNIPFNAGDMSLPAMDKNRADAASEEAKENSPSAPQYHPAFLRLYPTLKSCIEDQLHGKNNPNAANACTSLADKGDMSKMVFWETEKDENPAIDRIPKEIPQEAKSDLLAYLQYQEENTYTVRDWLGDGWQKFRNFVYGEGEKSGKAAGKGISETVAGMAGSVGSGFGKGLVDPLVDPNPDEGGGSGVDTTMLIILGGGVLLLILLMRK